MKKIELDYKTWIFISPNQLQLESLSPIKTPLNQQALLQISLQNMDIYFSESATIRVPFTNQDPS